jgi:hypothetical protein
MADSRPKDLLARITRGFTRHGRGAPDRALIVLMALSLPALVAFTSSPGAPRTTPGTARTTAKAIAPTSPAAKGTAPVPTSPAPAAKGAPAPETPKPSESVLPSDVTGAALPGSRGSSRTRNAGRGRRPTSSTPAPFPTRRG